MENVLHIGGTPTIRNSFVFPIICIFIPVERIFPALAVTVDVTVTLVSAKD